MDRLLLNAEFGAPMIISASRRKHDTTDDCNEDGTRKTDGTNRTLWSACDTQGSLCFFLNTDGGDMGLWKSTMEGLAAWFYLLGDDGDSAVDRLETAFGRLQGAIEEIVDSVGHPRFDDTHDSLSWAVDTLNGMIDWIDTEEGKAWADGIDSIGEDSEG